MQKAALPKPPQLQHAQFDRSTLAQIALMLIVRACTAHVMACARFARRGLDAERIHQLRTAIRRLRAALSISRQVTALPPAALLGGLRTLQQELGVAREWDVLIEEMIDTMPERLVTQEDFGKTVKAAETRRATEDECARNALRDPRCNDLLLQLTAWANHSLDTATHQSNGARSAASGTIVIFAAEFLLERRRKVRKLARRLQELDENGLHKLRIRIKKLRYAVEFFRHLWPRKRVRKYLTILKRLQNSLGRAHDAVVSKHLLMDLDPSFKRKNKSRKSLLDDWAAACLKRERGRTARLLRKLLQLKPLNE
jgi:triphosphatase